LSYGGNSTNWKRFWLPSIELAKEVGSNGSHIKNTFKYVLTIPDASKGTSVKKES
jgi:hypothetical protein